MTEIKNNIRQILLQKGRELVKEKGADFLTARKLSDATGYSVGTIYNQFSNMDNFVLAQNRLTLEELFAKLSILLPDKNPYLNLNRYVDAFVSYVLNHQDLWYLLYNFHLQNKNVVYPLSYRRQILKITNLWRGGLEKIYKGKKGVELKVFMQVLWLSLFSLSAYLTKNNLDKLSKINKRNLCQLLLNTYLAGLSTLR